MTRTRREHVKVISEGLEIEGDLLSARMDKEYSVPMGFVDLDSWNKNFVFGKAEVTRARLTIVMDLDPRTARVWESRPAARDALRQRQLARRTPLLPSQARRWFQQVQLVLRADQLISIGGDPIMIRQLVRTPPSRQLPR